MIVKDFDLGDVFLFSEILDKMDIELDTKKISRSVTTSKLEGKEDAAAIGKELALSMGGDLAVKVLRNFYKADRQVMQFIANMSGMQVDAVKKMNIKQIKGFFKELVEHEGFGDFLSQAGSSEVEVTE